ncbi:hypothetical protein L1987_50804 [Smallanthus sonchifolius]|uniref:Uncharacterized protein n=1 Tax=Smallanthus sonchifolius TaxID=185202 RepID=A0ACB9EN93_9ASTR|nr:hypothetical protein L1987_50804 [Smallanthus sonchifolius]
MCNARPCNWLHGHEKAQGIKHGTEDTVLGRGEREQEKAMHNHALGCTAVHPSTFPQLLSFSSYLASRLIHLLCFPLPRLGIPLLWIVIIGGWRGGFYDKRRVGLNQR